MRTFDVAAAELAGCPITIGDDESGFTELKSG
jgi:hypothetical protein